MKTELVTLVAAVLAAIASITGVFFSQRGALELERTKWSQARKDEAEKSKRIVIAEFAKDLSAAVQRASWIVWLAENDPEMLTQKDFSAYDRETKATMPKLVSGNVLVAGHDMVAYDKLTSLLQNYYSIDARIANAGVSFRKNHTQGLKELRAIGAQVRQLEDALPKAFAAVASATQPISE